MKKKLSTTLFDLYFVIYLILFTVAGYILFQYITQPQRFTHERFVSNQTTKPSSTSSGLPQCACPIQVPPEEWQQTVRDVKELKTQVASLISRFNPIEKEFKSANAAEAQQEKEI
jgi:cytoskeletal protein RodZ